jgi:hypothetical protein
MGRLRIRSSPPGSVPARHSGLIGPVSIGVLAALAVSLILLASPAQAAEGQSTSAATLVQEAIAIIRGQPELRSEIAGMISGAIAAGDTSGVDIGLVRQAQATFDAGDLPKTELLLEEAVGARPGQPVVSPNAGPRLPVPSASPPPVASHIRSLDRSRIEGAPAWILVGLALLAAVGGSTLVRRFR